MSCCVQKHEFFDIDSRIGMIVQPLIIDVIMEKKNYQLVAWTRRIEGQNEPEVRMIPSLHHEMQEPYFEEIARCRQEEASGHADPSLARRFVKVYEDNARFMFRTGCYSDGLRFLRMAALYCISSDDQAWTFWDTDLGSYTYFCGELRGEFLRLSKEFISLAHKYRRPDILAERKSKELLEMFREQTQEEHDLERHLDEMKSWN